MKKVLFAIIVLASFAFVFSSCEKEEDYSAPAMTTAKIEGRVEADLNQETTGLEKVPAGTKIFARINTADLVQNPIAGYTYEDKIYTTTVTAEGKYSFTVEAGKDPVAVSIWGEDFEYTITLWDGSTDDDRTIFGLPEGWYGANVTAGDYQVVDIQY